jgi:hypothetical protein
VFQRNPSLYKRELRVTYLFKALFCNKQAQIVGPINSKKREKGHDSPRDCALLVLWRKEWNIRANPSFKESQLNSIYLIMAQQGRDNEQEL